MSRAERWVARCLAGLVVALVLIGLVSGTPLRHLIQVIPAVFLLAAIAGRVPWASWAALPLFAFWFLIVLGIWLWLLGLANIITGHFTVPEVALTVVIGLCSVVGVVGAVRSLSHVGKLGLCLAFLSFAALQVIAMWFSLQPLVSER